MNLYTVTLSTEVRMTSLSSDSFIFMRFSSTCRTENPRFVDRSIKTLHIRLRWWDHQMYQRCLESVGYRAALPTGELQGYVTFQSASLYPFFSNGLTDHACRSLYLFARAITQRCGRVQKKPYGSRVVITLRLGHISMPEILLLAPPPKCSFTSQNQLPRITLQR
jgi:hypothetical protein